MFGRRDQVVYVMDLVQDQVVYVMDLVQVVFKYLTIFVSNWYGYI